ncbi:TetR/AcrR family transcriptional regulator [Nocardioides rubriscoriae]|uniref:TetR/AcrR family transcriptional regulator n=1 Tax=Nocardioides rubriscoriae TaxID=642762 RepID=UPI0011DFA8EC|nr:TetR/AcrR family transcriptional regulator [Nocardioides rubriscoriae]
MPTPPEVPKPLRRDAERNRRVVLDTARRLVAERGLDVGFEEIAREAGVGVGTVYRRFPHRADLVDALFADRIDEMVALAARALEVADPWEALVWFFERSAAAQAGDRGLLEAMVGDVEARERLDAARERMQPAVDAVVRRAREAGVLRPEIEVLDLAVLTMMISMATTTDQPDLWRRYVPVLLGGIRRRDDDEVLPLHPPQDHELPQIVHPAGRASRPART